MRRIVCALVVAAAACRKEAPPPPPECDVHRPCKQWFHCVPGSCTANASLVPQIANLARSDWTGPDTISITGTTEPSTTVQVFQYAGCQQGLFATVTPVQLAQGVTVKGDF